MAKELAVVCGGGGFIGGHLTKRLLAEGRYRVRVIDIKPLGEWYQRFDTSTSTPSSATPRARRCPSRRGTWSIP